MLKRRAEVPVRVDPVPEGAILGRRLSGGRALPIGESGVVWPFESIPRHAVIFGASGSGKTETSMRIANELASKTDAQIFYLDAKGDRGSAARFVSLMQEAGRKARVFPNEPFDSWRGDWRGIANRLLEVIEFVPEGPAAYYRDIAKTALQLACNHPDGPPRSSSELLRRLDYELLLNAHGPSTAVLSLPRDKVGQVRMRYEAFFGQLGCAFDGEWSWDDADAAYLLLDSVALGEDTAGAARMLFADFAHYFSQRKAKERFCLLFADEFSAVASASDVAMKVEQARSFNTGLVLVPQSLSGMGPRIQRDRILGSVETVIVHALNEPEELAALAGSKRVIELSQRYGHGIREREGFARQGERPKIDPDQIRVLQTGIAWVIRRGRATKVAIQAAPDAAGVELPEPVPLDSPLRQVEAAHPKQISYLEEDGGAG
jgi:hypothetical protein